MLCDHPANGQFQRALILLVADGWIVSHQQIAQQTLRHHTEEDNEVEE